MREPAGLKKLPVHLLLWSAAAMVVGASGLLGGALHPLFALLIGLTVGALTWLLTAGVRTAGAVGWPKPELPVHAPRTVVADRRTARMAASLPPTSAVGASELRVTLRNAADGALARRHGEHLPAGARHLTPKLATYLVDEGPAPALPRRTIVAHIKEIRNL